MKDDLPDYVNKIEMEMEVIKEEIRSGRLREDIIDGALMRAAEYLEAGRS